MSANKPTKPPTGSPSPGRAPGTPNNATAMKIVQIVRWKMAGVTNVKIADVLGVTPQAIHAIQQTDDYKEYEAAYMNGHISKMDEALSGHIDLIRAAFKPAIPLAMRTLVEAAMQRQDLPTALAAAKEILKRDPDRTLAEQSAGAGAAPGVPQEVLDAAVASNNDIAKSMQDQTKVN